MPTKSLVTLHVIAARQTIELARLIAPEELALPTPCADWNLRQLLDHMTTENLGFASAASGHGDDPAPWIGDPDRQDPVTDYIAATDALMSAFAVPDVLQRSFALPLLSKEHEFPGEQAVMMQLVDSVVHAWDLARTLDVPLAVEDVITCPTLALCEQIPDDESRLVAGAAFGPAEPFANDSPALEQIVALLGRSPAWSSRR